MPGIRVVTDSASDLPVAIERDLGIEIVPLTYRFGEEEFTDRRDLTSEQFWARCDKSPTLPETAAPSPGGRFLPWPGRRGPRRNPSLTVLIPRLMVTCITMGDSVKPVSRSL